LGKISLDLFDGCQKVLSKKCIEEWVFKAMQIVIFIGKQMKYIQADF
jgi:hypothetical protein